MKFFKALVCVTTLPDDHEWDEAGEETVKPGGESAARTLADLLKQAGMDVSAPELWEDYGWCFDVKRDKRQYQIVVSRIDKEFYIHTKDKSGCLVSPWGNRADHPVFMDLIYKLVSEDPRFGSPKWLTDKPYVGTA